MARLFPTLRLAAGSSAAFVARRAVAVPRSPWLWAALGLLCGVLVAVVCFAPAVWVVRGIQALSQGRVQLSDGEGTVWSGSARMSLTGGPGSADAERLPGRLHWTLGLGWGNVRLGLLADCCTARPVQLEWAPARTLAFWSGWALQVGPSQSTWPAALLAGWGTPWNTVQAQGNLVLETAGFTMQSDQGRIAFSGQVQLDARNMHSRLSTLRPLGSYRIQLGGGAEPSLDLSTLDGKLRLSGKGHWSAGRLRFVGEASAEPDHAQELSNLLNIMGRRSGVRSVITLG